jgi:phenylacetate-CoA ligase
VLGSVYSYTLEHAVMPFGDRLNGGRFMHWLRRYRAEQWLPADKMRELTHDRLSSILTYARHEVPYYRKNIDVSSDPFYDLSQFPVVTKTEIKKNVQDLITRPLTDMIAESGSGSTGVQGTVYVDKSAQASQRAMQMLWFEWAGYRMGDSILQTGITPDRGLLKGTKDILLNTKYISAFDLGPKAIADVLNDLRRRPRKFLFGYASSLHVLANEALERGIEDIRFEHAVSWGDKLFENYRESVRKAFGCRVTDTYGCTEGAMIAAQCSEGSYHLSVNQCHVEILDDHGAPLPDGEIGNVVATRLDNFAMPLIRYRLGDIAAIEPAADTFCKCGRQTPLLNGLIGRDTDVVVTASGKKMIVHFFTGIFEHVPEIRQFKIVQESVDQIKIEFIPDQGFSDSVLKTLEKRMNSRLNERLPITWSRVEKISASGSGKPQIIQSSMTPREISDIARNAAQGRVESGSETIS